MASLFIGRLHYKLRGVGLNLSFYSNFVITKHCQHLIRRHMVSDLGLYCLSMFNKENAG